MSPQFVEALVCRWIAIPCTTCTCDEMQLSSSVGAVVGEREWPISEGVFQVRLKNCEALKSLLLEFRHLDEDFQICHHKCIFATFATNGALHWPSRWAKFVSKFDLLKGYLQVPLSLRAQEISAFRTPSDPYSYKVMPFGLHDATATFQQLMNLVVEGLSVCV